MCSAAHAPAAEWDIRWAWVTFAGALGALNGLYSANRDQTASAGPQDITRAAASPAQLIDLDGEETLETDDDQYGAGVAEDADLALPCPGTGPNDARGSGQVRAG